MNDSGNRYRITVSPNQFFITENISGKKISFVDNQFMNFELDEKDIIDKIQTIQEAILTYTKVRRIHIPRLLVTHSDTVQIDEYGHYKWRLVAGKKKAGIKDGQIHMQFGFDVDQTLRSLSFITSIIHNYKQPRNPKYDIVRRIADAGLLVWVNGKDSLVVYEKDVDGLTMQDVIVNADYYSVLLVGIRKDVGLVSLLNCNLEEVISFPLDDSVLEYYPEELNII